MACSSCGQSRMQMSRNTGAVQRNSSSSSANSVRTVDSQTIKKVQSAVASNPNSIKRTKV